MELTLLKLSDAARIANLEEKKATQEQSAREAIGPQLFSSLVAGDSEDARFRRITSPATIRDLNPTMHERMQQVCFFLFMTTPFGKRIVRVMVDYVVGEGFKVRAEDPALQEVTDAFWNAPKNNLEENLDTYMAELLVFGELCLPVAVNPVDGFVTLGYVDPQTIESVQFSLIDTGNGQEISVASAVKLRARIGETDGRTLQIIRRDDDPHSPTFGKLTGDCFYFAINKVKAASRGISELFSLADWIDVFDNMVFDFADRVRLLNSFVWHYVLKGADQPTVEKMRDRVTKSPPRQGGVEVTNDQVTIEARTPDLKGADMSEAARVVKLYGMGGAGLPAWFFADPVDANRATAEEMAGPTGKMLTSRQNVAKRMVTVIVNFVIEQAVEHGVLSQDADLTYKLQVPDLSVKDLGAAATALQALTASVAIAEDRGWIQGLTASRAVQTLLTQIGVETDADEFDEAQQEKTNRDAKQQNNLDPQANLADALKKVQPDALAKMPPVTSVKQ
jgi:hypothetical protein